MKNILNLFTAPKKLYANIKEKPTFLAPLIIIIIMAIVTQYLSTFTIIQSPEYLSSQVLEATGNADIANMYAMNAQSAQGFSITSVLISVVTILTIIIAMVVSTAVILLLSKIFGGKGDFKTFLSMNFYNYIIPYIFALLSVIFMILLNTPKDIFSIATIVMPNGNIYDPLFVLLGTISIPTIYCFILSVIGIREIAEFESNVKSVIISIMLYIFPTLIQVGLIIVNANIMSNF